MKITTTILIALATCSAHAATIIGFEAESGALGSEYSTGADGTALGGTYIEHINDAFPFGANQPNTDSFTVSYDLNLAAGTYDVYVKMRFPSNGEDSFFIATNFGDTDPTVTADWLKIENIPAYGTYGGISEFTWSNPLAATLTTTGGPVTWEIGAREAGNDIDAFAFVLTGESVTATDLDNAVIASIPEPSTTALLGLGGLALILRRRK